MYVPNAIVKISSLLITLCTIPLTVWSLDNNQATVHCLQKYNYDGNVLNIDWNKISKCQQKFIIESESEKLKELRDFLKHNPRYRYPGQSLNKCFNKPREMPFESAWIERSGNGFKAGVSYKDKLPADCYQTKPWDNREKNVK